MNAAEAVIGFYYPNDGSGAMNPFFWEGGSTATLPGSAGRQYSQCIGVNDWPDPWIVGIEAPADDSGLAKLWVRLAGQWKQKDLGTYDAAAGTNGRVFGYATAVNNRGQIVGSFATRGTDGHYTFVGNLWQNGRILDGTTGGIMPGWAIYPRDLNNLEVIIGQGARLMRTAPRRSAATSR